MPPTIDAILREFLDDQRERLATSTYRRYEDVIRLLRHCLDGYGHQSLFGIEEKRWRKAYDAGDEEAFCNLMGPQRIVENSGEFLGYFMIRKVMAGEELLKAAGTVTKKLAKWLHEHGYIDEDAAEIAAERGADAVRELPRAGRLSRLLYELSRRSPVISDSDSIADDDWVEDYLMIEKVEPGRLWFEGEIGPLEVPKPASDLAQEGWTVNIVLARIKGRWYVREVGNVYP